MAETRRRKPKVRRFTAERRAQFLEHLRRTGNHGAAAKAVGLNRSSAEQRRKRDAEFAIGCAEAEAEASRRLAGASDIFDGVADAEFERVERRRSGRLMIVKTRVGKWCKSKETLFLDALRACGNVAASARAVGVSESMVWTRRRQWPGFALKIEEALGEAELVLEFRLATLGNNVGTGARDEDGAEMGTVTGNCPQSFDPDLAIRFLKWREEKRRGGGRRGRPGKGPPERTFKEAVDSVLRKVAAIERHENVRKLAEGWSQDEEGRMIPPGWVRGL
jgi:molybdenum-dependent DNA-binding transcriptional regulator ModE